MGYKERFRWQFLSREENCRGMNTSQYLIDFLAAIYMAWGFDELLPVTDFILVPSTGMN